jgi:thiazole/oxazole-forming peptide maturase SagD family component
MKPTSATWERLVPPAFGIHSRSAFGDHDLFTDSEGVTTDIVEGATSLADSPLYGVAWPNSAIVSDTAGFGITEQFNPDIFGRLDPCVHHYFVCARNPKPFLNLLLEGVQHDISPILIYGRRVILGPRFGKHEASCSACFAIALLTNLPSLRQRWSDDHTILLQTESVPKLRAVVESLILMREAPHPRYEPGIVTTIDMLDGTLARERQILRLCKNCSTRGSIFNTCLDTADDFVGELIGAVRRVSSVNARPHCFSIKSAESALIPELSLGGGVALNQDRATRKALFETIERLVCRHIRHTAVRMAVADVSCNNRLPIEDYQLFSDEQYLEPAFRFRKINQDTSLFWMAGYRVRDSRLLWLPADHVSCDIQISAHNKVVPLTTNGTAAHESRANAQENAVLELIERDVITRCWYRRRLRKLPIETLGSYVKRQLSKEKLELGLYLCDMVNFAPVVVATLMDSGAGVGSIGTGAGSTLSTAVPNAISNAATMFAYRETNGTLLRLQGLANIEFASDEALRTTINWDHILDHYDPVCTVLSDKLLIARDIFVIRAWSNKAVDYVQKGVPLPLRRWTPDAEERIALSLEEDLF